MNSRGDRRSMLIAAGLSLALVAVTLIVYWPASNFEFLQFDDPGYLQESPLVRAGLSGDTLRRSFTEVHQSNWHPLTTIVYLIERQIFGLENARGFHTVNIILHALNAGLLCFVLCMMTAAPWRCAVAAALFALHPLHVESVAWISELKDVLSMFFMLLTLAAYAMYVRSRSKSWYVMTLALYVLALLSKPMVVTLPLVLLLLDAWPLKRSRRWGLLVEKIPFFLLAIGVSIATVLAQRVGGALQSLERFPLSDRVPNALLSYAMYLFKMIWPARLSPYYAYGTTVEGWIPGLIVLLAISAVVFALRRRAPYLLVGWLWYLVTLLPVIGLVQVGAQAMADRYTYIPLIGPFIAIVWAIADLIRNRAALAILAVVVLGALTFRTHAQLPWWRTTGTLFRHVLEDHPNHARAHFYVAVDLAGEKKFDEAIVHLKEAVRLEPNSPEARVQLGMTLLEAGRMDEALPVLRDGATMAEMQLAAVGPVPRTQRLASGAHQNLGVLHARRNEFAEAAEEFEKATRGDETNLDALAMLAPAWLRAGQLERAAAAADRLAPFKPELSAQQQFEIAMALRKSGKFAAAAECYRRVIALNPKSTARNNLAWLLATCPDASVRNGAEAVRLGESMKQQFGELPEVLDTLAAAYAESGDFNKAAVVADQAATLAMGKKQAGLEKDIRARAELYKSGKAFREW